MPATLRILKGRIVTMTGQVIKNGRLCIRDNVIAHVLASQDGTPAEFAQVSVVDTGGVLYPGLIDLHNHLPYNILRSWAVPEPYKNRDTWRDAREYARDLSQPMGKLLPSKGPQHLASSVVRYVEAKALLGGTTTIQGMVSKVSGVNLYRGIVRNVEAPDEPGMPRATSNIKNVQDIDPIALNAALNAGKTFFVHLAEGIDDGAQAQVKFLHDQGWARPHLVCIHCIGNDAANPQRLHARGVPCVWSPLSNLLLYGKTVAPDSLGNLSFVLGCDWSPSGGKNLLQELKVAWLVGQQVGPALSWEVLAKAVTIHPANAVQWGRWLGSLEAGKLADVLVLDDLHADAYENLGRATERNIRALLVNGQPRLADPGLMTALKPGAPLEPISVGGRDKRLALRDAGAPLESLSLDEAVKRLATAMANLDKPIEAWPVPLWEKDAGLEPDVNIELDMQADNDAGMFEKFNLQPLTQVPLDALTVDDDPAYWQALDRQVNLPPWLKGPDGLRAFYA
jgi:Amidohydrolase family